MDALEFIRERNRMCKSFGDGEGCMSCPFYKSVKYTAKIVNTNPLSENRYMHILVCNKCALVHNDDFIEQEA